VDLELLKVALDTEIEKISYTEESLNSLKELSSAIGRVLNTQMGVRKNENC
jgi:hypothetical protein